MTPEVNVSVEVSTFSPTSALLVSPWIWLTLSILVLCGLLFVSFRKQRAVELYHQGREYLWSKLLLLKERSPIRLPTTSSLTPSTSNSRPTRTRLSRSLSTSSSLSSSSSNDNDASRDDEDELLPFTSLPSSTNSTRYASLQRKSRSMLENLGENVLSVGRNVVDSLGWNDETNEERGVGSMKRLLMGKRDVDRGLGGIRLGEEGGNLFELGGEDEEDGNLTTTGTMRPTTGARR
ncbi:uncharacterized protein JCM6883_001814 [Sporobolomyces salmoneus]|uniref:uncharacterized protein n=1 Tax=Sporobolomyces salmoneus TaxID=183962 RepID=UPI0031773026